MEGEGDVVALPCGHPYMLDRNDDIASAVICSVCNTRYAEEPASDDSLPDLDLQETQLCPVHGDPLRMWCRDCNEPACGLCVFDKHQMPTHMVEPANLYVSDTKNEMLAHLDRLHRRTRRGIARNKKAFHACEIQLLKLFRDDKELLQLDGSLRKIKHLVESATAVRTLSHARKELGWIQAKVWNSPMIRDDDDEEPDDLQGASAMAQRRVEDLDTAVESLGVQVSLENGRRARLEWEEDRLLVCTTSEASAQPKPVLQLLAVESLGSAPFPEVFLELSVGTVPFGIVYIKLWGHLRRAQNFMLLCMGSLGPSFVGSHLLSVNGRGTAGESIGAGMYKNGRGVMSAVPLLTGLEYGGIYQTEVSRGLLVASSGGNPALDSLYSIITGDGAGGGYSQCKFGWVVSGLEYLREAAHHQPIKQVWVSQCGLVLPRHT